MNCRCRNKEGEGEQLTNLVKIFNHMSNYFHGNFESEGIELDNDILNLFENFINEETNHNLTKMLSEEEIKRVIFKMGKHKSLGPDGYQGTLIHTF